MCFNKLHENKRFTEEIFRRDGSSVVHVARSAHLMKSFQIRFRHREKSLFYPLYCSHLALRPLGNVLHSLSSEGPFTESGTDRWQMHRE